MSLTPDESTALDREIAQEMADGLEETLREMWDEGAFGLARGKPQQRLHGYMAGTIGGDEYLRSGLITGDLMLLLSDDYPEKRKAGTMPRLQAEDIEEARLLSQTMNMAAQEQGLPPIYNEVPAPPQLWVLVLQKLPVYVATWAISDMRALMRTRTREQLRQEPSFANADNAQPVTEVSYA